MDFNKKEDLDLVKQVVNDGYPAIVVAGTFASGADIIDSGTPVAFDATGNYVPCDLAAEDTTKDVIGVTTKKVDVTAAGTIAGSVMRFGVVHTEALTDSSADMLKALAAQKIFAS